MKIFFRCAIFAVCAPAAFYISGCVSMPETERELAEGRAEAAKLAGRDIAYIKIRTPDFVSKSDISVEKLYNELQFNPDGASIYSVALRDVIGAHYARVFKDEAVRRVAELFPNIEPTDNEADAFRHAYFSFRLADKIGDKRAKAFTDAYEISNVNKLGGRCMDLWNNREGRRMSAETKGEKLSDRRALAEKLTLNAIKSGRLVLKPFKLELE